MRVLTAALSKDIRSDPGLAGAERFRGPLRRLAHFADGRIQEDSGDILVSSSSSLWAGFHLERHMVSPGCEKDVYWPTPRLWLVGTGQI